MSPEEIGPDDVSGRKQKLGRGLSALLGEERAQFGSAGRNRGQNQALIGALRPNRLQPRNRFDETQLRELADSIVKKGVLQPILVRPVPADAASGGIEYEIIAGERRWRAAQMARLHEVPIVVRELNDGESLELALIENIQRADLNAMEEARGYARLIEQFDHNQEDVARLVGKSRSHVANLLRLLALPMAVQAMIEDGRLSAGHARALVTAHDPEMMAQQIIQGGLSVRAAEELTKRRRPKTGGNPALKPPVEPDLTGIPGPKGPNTLALEAQLSGNIGLQVTIEDYGVGSGGVLCITYRTLEQLDDLCLRLGPRHRL